MQKNSVAGNKLFDNIAYSFSSLMLRSGMQRLMVECYITGPE